MALNRKKDVRKSSKATPDKNKTGVAKRKHERVKKVDTDALRRNIRDSTFSEKRKVVKAKAHKTIWMRTFTAQQVKYLDLMRVPTKMRNKYAKNRVIMSLVILIFGSIIGLLMKNSYILYGSIIFGLFIFFQKGYALKGQYKRYQFRQELAFAKFFSNLAPMLTSVVEGSSLYQVLLKLEPRMEDPESRRTVRQFMLNINEQPNSDEPFIQVAKSFSNSPESVTQMLSVSQIVQSNSGMAVVRRLARSSADELMAKVDAIVMAKKRKFFSITTQITMASMPMIFGIVVGMIIAQMTSMFSTLHMG